MSTSVNAIVQVISEPNNRYRDSATPIRQKLEALWEIGDRLIKLGVSKLHSVGWAVQRETRGLIKRPTVFRSHKIRTIWSTKEELLRDLGELQGLSRLTELLPIIDPGQGVRGRLSATEIADLYKHACSNNARKFKVRVGALKKQLSHGKLGKSLDRSKHLPKLREVVFNFRAFKSSLLKLVEHASEDAREQIREIIPAHELRAFSNMCIALTTKDNYRLYKRLSPMTSNSGNSEFKFLFDRFRVTLDKTSDVERARLRRLISAEAFAQMSDLVSSLTSEAGVEDFKARQKIAIPF